MNSPEFDIDPDIHRARTMPGRFYTDAATYARVLDRVFAGSWQFVGDGAAPRVGLACDAAADAQRTARDDTPRELCTIAPFTLLEGSLAEPLMLTRDEHGTLRCLSNVCTHRANIVATERSAARTLVCGYHGRRFALDGRFRSCSEFETAAEFPSASDHLPDLPLARFGNLLFTTITKRDDFDARFGDIAARLAWLPHDALVFEAASSRDFEFDANWALYCDNYLEGFHIPFVHPTLNEAIDFGTYTTEIFAESSLQIGLAKPGKVALTPPPSSPDHGKRIAGYYAWLSPNLMLNYYPWGLSLNLVEPLGIARTRVKFRSYVWDTSKRDLGAGRGLEAVEMEDESVVLRAQSGVRSRLYDRGRYSPTREQGVHHFHRLLARSLAT